MTHPPLGHPSISTVLRMNRAAQKAEDQAWAGSSLDFTGLVALQRFVHSPHPAKIIPCNNQSTKYSFMNHWKFVLGFGYCTGCASSSLESHQQKLRCPTRRVVKMGVSPIKLGRSWWIVRLVTHVPWTSGQSPTVGH